MMNENLTSSSKTADSQSEADFTGPEPYYATARSWAADRQDALAGSRRTAWIVAAAAGCIAVLEALVLVSLAPLKTVVPYTLMVDRTTGYVEVLKGAEPSQISPNAAITQSLLAQYVVARETFYIESLAAQYRKVALLSAEAARAEYLATMPASNPASPINLYPRSTVVETRVESLSQIAPLTDIVRFVTERRDLNQLKGRPVYWSAVIKYRFSGQPMSLEDRLVNPLGFQVTSYHRDQESPPLPDPAAPAAAAATTLAAPDEDSGVGPTLQADRRQRMGSYR